MKHKYNIPNLLLGVIGHKGLPFPGGFIPTRPGRASEKYELTPEASPREEYVKEPACTLKMHSAGGTSCQ